MGENTFPVLRHLEVKQAELDFIKKVAAEGIKCPECGEGDQSLDDVEVQAEWEIKEGKDVLTDPSSLRLTVPCYGDPHGYSHSFIVKVRVVGIEKE